MERLTYFENGHWRLDFNGCQYQADFVDRLAAYEDTGLTPESVEALKLSMMGKAVSEITEFNGIPIDRLRELAEADKEGRVVVLPCKVGETVWIAGSVRGVYGAKVRTFFVGNPSAVRGTDGDGGIQMIRTTECDVPIKDFEKTVFLTREEAEAALKEVQNG